MKNQLQVPQISTKEFTYSPDSKTFATEASSLRKQFLGQLYNDSSDIGLELVSAKTGVPARFVVEHYQSIDGEFIAWRLVPTPETLRAQPSLEGVKVVIFNT